MAKSTPSLPPAKAAKPVAAPAKAAKPVAAPAKAAKPVLAPKNPGAEPKTMKRFGVRGAVAAALSASPKTPVVLGALCESLAKDFPEYLDHRKSGPECFRGWVTGVHRHLVKTGVPCSPLEGLREVLNKKPAKAAKPVAAPAKAVKPVAAPAKAVKPVAAPAKASKAERIAMAEDLGLDG